jgi:hypothetical protein
MTPDRGVERLVLNVLALGFFAYCLVALGGHQRSELAPLILTRCGIRVNNFSTRISLILDETCPKH